MKFGIVISKDKLKINSAEQGASRSGEDVCNVPFKVGGGPDCAPDGEAPVLKHEESLPPECCPLYVTETDLFEQELKIFQQVLCSMVAPSCTPDDSSKVARSHCVFVIAASTRCTLPSPVPLHVNDGKCRELTASARVPANRFVELRSCLSSRKIA